MRAVLARGAGGSLLLTAGGYGYVRLPRGTWMDHVPLVWSVRAQPHHLLWGLLVSSAGLVLLTWAWWDLRRMVADADGLSQVRRAAALWTVPMLLAPPLFSGDGWSYVATGDLAGHGLSPYLWAPAVLPEPLRSGVSPAWLLTPSPYGPLPLAWGGAFSRFVHDPWVLLACYRLAALISLAVLAWAVPVLAARAGVDPADAAVLVVASPFVLAHGVGGLHNDIWVAAFVAAALVVTRQGRWFPGAVLVGAAAAVKAPGIVAAVGVVLLSTGPGAGWVVRLRRSASVGAAAVGTVVVTGWMTGLGTGWIQALAVPDREHTVLSVSSVLGHLARVALESTGSIGGYLVAEIHPEVLVKRGAVGLFLLVAAWVLLRRRNATQREALTGAGVVLLAAVVLSPVVHYWYYLWGLPVLACVPLARPARSALVAAVLTLGLTAPADKAVHLPWMWQAAAWALAVVPAATWVVVASRNPPVRVPARAGD